MHIHPVERWQHPHNFSVNYERSERKTKIVMLLTAITMVAEIVAGSVFGSLALLADGWHMATHVGAFGITLFAYQYARRHATDPRYTFGTGKVSVLGGFASAIALGVVAFIMVFESVERLFQPNEIQFNEAIWVAIIGLVVNLVSALLLQDYHGHDHGHAHGHQHEHKHDHHDHDHPKQAESSDPNLRAAYVHVLADALTSILAIAALFAGKYLDWIWMDALMGLVGATVIARWAYGLVRETGTVLLDGGVDKQTKLDIISLVEADADTKVIDLHVWYISQNHLSATIALVTHNPKMPEYYRTLLKRIPSLSHVIVEVNPCQGETCMELQADPSLKRSPSQSS